MGSNLKFLIKLLIFAILPSAILCLFEGCDENVSISGTAITYASSKNYSNYYTAGSSCRKTYQAPTDYVIKATCNIEIYSNNGSCTTDAFYVDREGDRGLTTAGYFCGTKQVVTTSIWNTITFANVGSHAGKWQCKLEPSYNNVCDCGWSVSKYIVGGIETTDNQYPPMVGLTYNNEVLPFCGAAIISHRYILCAAHCFSANNDPTSMFARVGDQDVTITGDTRYEKNYNILQIIIHASYNTTTHQNDIALLRTTVDITWQRGVAPVCLPFKYSTNQFVGSTVSIAGWGSIDYGYPQSDTLLDIDVNVISNTVCNSTQSSAITSKQICVLGDNEDTCQHDSGGSLFWTNGGRQYTVGLVSFGEGCNNGKPSVNTRVTEFLTWITDNTVSTVFCSL